MSGTQDMSTQINALADKLEDDISNPEMTTQGFRNAVNNFCAEISSLETDATKALVEKLNENAANRSLFGRTRKLMQGSQDTAALAKHVLPGGDDYVQNLHSLVNDLNSKFGEEVNDQLDRVGDSWKENLTQIDSTVRIRALTTCTDIAQLILSPIDETVSEVKNLAYQSSALRSLIDKWYQVIMDKDGFHQFGAQVKELVGVVNKFPLRNTKVWLRIYELISVLHAVASLVSVITVLRVLLRFHSHWTWWQDAFILLSVVTFGAAIIFVNYFAFLAATGRLDEMRVTTAQPQQKVVRDLEAPTQAGEVKQQSCGQNVKDFIVKWRFTIVMMLFAIVFIVLIVVPDSNSTEACFVLWEAVTSL
jgi:hypothetical protein